MYQYANFEKISTVKSCVSAVTLTNDGLSNDTKVDYLVTLTVAFALQRLFRTLLPPGHSVSQTHLVLFSLIFQLGIVGPMTKTVADFWLMIWQHKCEVVVMLTQFRENNKVWANRVSSHDYQHNAIKTLL